MKNDAQKIFSLAAVIVAATLFGMVLSGGLNITQQVDADLPDAAPAATMGEMVLPDFVALADHRSCRS